MKNTNKAFTLVEIMVTIMIVAIIMAIAVPSYVKMVKKTDERNMIANLSSMRSAATIYTSHSGPLGAWGSLAIINTNLGLSLVDTRASYSCSPAQTCSATHPDGWGVRFSAVNAGIFCFNGPCPSCVANCG